MMLYASSCERPSKSSARVFLPSSVSNSYSFSTGTQGRSRRLFLISSFRSACSASSFASSSRAACHSSRVPIFCSGISSPFLFGLSRSVASNPSWVGRYRDHELRPLAPRKLIAALLEPQRLGRFAGRLDPRLAGDTSLRTNSGDGRYSFVSWSGSDRISAISYKRREEVAQVPVGDHPQRMRMGVVPRTWLQ